MKKGKKMASRTQVKSAPIRVDVGSGSRPMGGKIKIPTSAPGNEHTLERAPKNWLK